LQRTSTGQGMQISERRPQPENIDCSLRNNLQPVSNVTRERLSHDSKHSSPRISTDEGLQIDHSDDPENVDASIRLTRQGRILNTDARNMFIPVETTRTQMLDTTRNYWAPKSFRFGAKILDRRSPRASLGLPSSHPSANSAPS
jgi:hypothetical protein